MEDIFKYLKKYYESEQGGTFLWDTPKNITIEEKLQYIILKQRYLNLGVFLEKQKNRYKYLELERLQELLFFYNDLKEMHFIGTDMYADVLFLKSKVPYLYRSVGKEQIFETEEIEYCKHLKKIFEDCLNQIKVGNKGKMFSYTKCFGKMLYKYTTLIECKKSVTIEIRKEQVINAISKDGNNFISIQEYARNCHMYQEDEKDFLPYFIIDMSNVRDDKVEYLRLWFDEFLGKQDWGYYDDIVDPIGDAEVICNFTNNLQCNNFDNVYREDFNRDELCVLLYKYFMKYAEEQRNVDDFNRLVFTTLENLKIRNIQFANFYEQIIKDELYINYEKINSILRMIDWSEEIKYMTRRESNSEIDPMRVYKGDNSEELSGLWKNILFNAIEGTWTYYEG